MGSSPTRCTKERTAVCFSCINYSVRQTRKREKHKALRCCEELVLSYGTMDIKRARSFFLLNAIDAKYWKRTAGYLINVHLLRQRAEYRTVAVNNSSSERDSRKIVRINLLYVPLYT